jgi:predicted aminopeptidase
MNMQNKGVRLASSRRRFFKRVMIVFAIILIALLALNIELVRYGLGQAKGQLQIINDARPIDEVLKDPLFPDSLKKNLRLIDDIKRFAFDSLGIKHSDNYSRVYDQKGKEIMFVVTACKPYALEPREWSFPLIGTFSYKGFFDRTKAEYLASQLQSEGLDVNVRTAGGWSTLGWFEDPILSNMLADSEAEFAETIIHELTHGTLFVKDSVRFNENLATFVGIKGSERYLATKYGIKSNEVLDYKQLWADRNAVSRHILRGAQHLDSLYQAMEETMSIAIRQQMKEKAIGKILNELDTLSISDLKKYKNYYLKNPPNNTLFMSYLRYRGDFTLLSRELHDRYDGDIKKLLDDYKEKYPSL